MSKNVLEKLVSEVGAYRLARMLGVKHPTVHTWLKIGRVPAERVLAVEAATGVSRYELRPDVYGPAPEDRTHNQRATDSQAAA